MPRFCHLTDKQSLIILVLVFAGVSGCTSIHPQRKPAVPTSSSPPKANPGKIKSAAVIPIPEKLPCYRQYQDEISALKQMLVEKDEVIRNLNARELDQAQALQETTSEVSRTKNKLHKLATQPVAASKIAEVEVAMAALKQTQLDEADTAFRFLAQRSLDAAMVAYRQNDYSNTMDRATESMEFIGAVTNRARKNLESQDIVSSFRAPIPLLVTQMSSLRTSPDGFSRAIGLVKRNTPLTATAYQGNWLNVRTEKDLSGWIQNSAVDIRINQDFQK